MYLSICPLVDLYARKACPTVKNIVKVHCNLRLVVTIEEKIGHSDHSIG